MNSDRTFNREDASLLVRLADQLDRGGSDAEIEISDRVSELISGAVMLPEGERSTEHVELGAVVTYEHAGNGEQHTVTIVAPQDADARAARFSVLTPVGLALIGVAVGAESEVILPSGRTQEIRVLSAHPDFLPAA